MQRFQIFIIFTIIIVFIGCAKDKLDPNTDTCTEEITYLEHTRSIINKTCAYSGCHDGVGAPGDYTSFEAMQSSLSENLFRNRVIESQNMPPNYATGPTSLTVDELALMRCWIEGGFQE